MNTKLYEDLGVLVDATQEQIKNAYRAKAKECHPDKPTGSEMEFKKVASAYMVLSDPEKRKRYDEGGEKAAGMSEEERQKREINGWILHQVNAFLLSNFDLQTTDLKKGLLDVIRTRRREINNEIKAKAYLYKRLKRAKKRFINPIPIIEGLFIQLLNEHKQAIKKNKTDLQILGKTEEMINQIEYLFEKKIIIPFEDRKPGDVSHHTGPGGMKVRFEW